MGNERSLIGNDVVLMVLRVEISRGQWMCNDVVLRRVHKCP